MFQVSLPSPDTAQLEVPLPSAFERWRDLYLHSGFERLIVFLGIALLLYLVLRLARHQIRDHIQEINRRHTLRKWVGYGYVVALAVVALALFSNALAGFGTIVGLVLAGVAVALQDVLKSVVGWLYASTRSGIQVGSRIEVGGVVGDVIDIGVLKTTLLEVGNLVYGRQSTGRLITIPNYHLLSDNVLVSAGIHPFVWQEVRVQVTYESDWRRAEAILQEIGDDLHADIADDLERGFRAMEKRFAFKYGKLTPIVYVSLAGSGVDLTLRYLMHDRRRRGTSDYVTRRVLERFEQEPEVELAYPTYRIYRAGEEDE